MIPINAYSQGLALNKLGRIDGKLCRLHCQAQPGTDIRACCHKQVLKLTVAQQVPPHLQQNTDTYTSSHNNSMQLMCPDLSLAHPRNCMPFKKPEQVQRNPSMDVNPSTAYCFLSVLIYYNFKGRKAIIMQQQES
jgi:hypothetical protein